MTLQEEQQKARYEHKLQLWRIVIDKVLLGMMIAALAYLGNIYLESYKSGLTQERFLLETRLDALKEIRDSYSTLSRQTEQLMNKSGEESYTDKLERYKKALDSFIDATNEWSMLFSPTFDRDTKHHMWTHGSIALGAVRPTEDHWTFFKELFQHFDDLTRKALWEETLGVTGDVASTKFEFEEWDEEKMQQQGVKVYFDKQLKKWHNTSAE